MSLRRAVRAPILALLGALALPACSGGTGPPGGDGALASALSLARGLRTEAPPARGPFTRAELAGAGLSGPVLLARVERTGARAALVPEAANGGAVTWRAGDAVTVSTRGGLLVATRGLRFDLMSADDGLFRETLAAGGGRYVRVIRDLTAEGVLRRIDLTCTLMRGGAGTAQVAGRGYAVTRWSEACSGPVGPAYPEAPGGRIENVYEIDSAGTIRSSRQWAAPHLGYLTLEIGEI